MRIGVLSRCGGLKMKVKPKRYRTRDVRKFASGEFQEFAMANSEPLAVGLSELIHCRAKP